MLTLRSTLAKHLLPYGISGDAIDAMAERIQPDILCPVFDITPLQVKEIRIVIKPNYEGETNIYIYIGRRDWQFDMAGGMMGAWCGLCCPIMDKEE